VLSTHAQALGLVKCLESKGALVNYSGGSGDGSGSGGGSGGGIGDGDDAFKVSVSSLIFDGIR
jgi:hypothetical protein